MKKKLLLLSLVGTTTLTSLVIAGLTLSDASSFTIAANGGNVQHNLVMTTENTTVSIEAGEDFDYLIMDSYTAHGNKFGCSDGSEIETWCDVKCNTEDALFEVTDEYDDTIDLRLYIGFDFNLDVEEGENVAACMYYKLKTEDGWDESPKYWDWSSLDAEGKYAVFTFDKNVGGVYGFKLISCNFTYTCSY